MPPVKKDYKKLIEKLDKKLVLNWLPDLHDQAFEKINCLECAECCKNYSPTFNTTDIKRITKFLKMKEGDFVEKYLKLDKENDYVVKSSPCPFLGTDNYCSIYEVRPRDCEHFPYTDEDVFLKKKNLTYKNSTFCPAVQSVLDAIEVKLKQLK